MKGIILLENIPEPLAKVKLAVRMEKRKEV